MVSVTNEEIEEFHIEAQELLDEAEGKLLGLDRGGEFPPVFDAVFRVFHSLKGASGFLGIDKLQSHMHELESQYQEFKTSVGMEAHEVDYFLKGVDIARRILAGEDCSFDYTRLGNKESPSSSSEKIAILIALPELASRELQALGYTTYEFSDTFEGLGRAQELGASLFMVESSNPDLTRDECEKLLKIELPGCELKIFEARSSNVPSASGPVPEALGEVEEKLNHTLEVLFNRLPDIALCLEASGKHELLKSVDDEFRTLVALKRKLKAS